MSLNESIVEDVAYGKSYDTLQLHSLLGMTFI
jgi:hypothetical protein